MPIYGYRCQACDQEFEVTQRMSDPAIASCPACHGAGTRLFFPAGIVFKGSGFYKTDSRSASTTAPASAADGAKKTDTAATDASAAKPATEPKGSRESKSSPAAPSASPASTASSNGSNPSTSTAKP